MNKRASLPGANELFRATESPEPAEAPIEKPARRLVDAEDVEAPAASGRIKHDHKITVYFSDDELNALEDAKLTLGRSHGIRVDRGRIVRVALAQALTDLGVNGADSALVRELDN